MKTNPIVNIPIVDVARLEQIMAEIYGIRLGIIDLSQEIIAYDLQLQEVAEWSYVKEAIAQGGKTYSHGSSPEQLTRKREANYQGIAQSEAKIQKLEMEWQLKMTLLNLCAKDLPLRDDPTRLNPDSWTRQMHAALAKPPVKLYPLQDVDSNVGGALSEQE